MARREDVVVSVYDDADSLFRGDPRGIPDDASDSEAGRLLVLAAIELLGYAFGDHPYEKGAGQDELAERYGVKLASLDWSPAAPPKP